MELYNRNSDTNIEEKKNRYLVSSILRGSIVPINFYGYLIYFILSYDKKKATKKLLIKINAK